MSTCKTCNDLGMIRKPGNSGPRTHREIFESYDPCLECAAGRSVQRVFDDYNRDPDWHVLPVHPEQHHAAREYTAAKGLVAE